MRSQVQVLAGPRLFSQLTVLPLPGQSHPLPAWAAVGPHVLRAVAPKAHPEQATQRPSHGRPPAGDHVPDDLRAAMPQVGETSPRTRLSTDERSLRNRLLLVGQAVEPGRWPRTSLRPRPSRPLCWPSTACASFERQAPTRADDQPVVETVRGDHADSGRPRRVTARRIGALYELTRFGHSRGGNARIADAGCPDAGHRHRTPTPDSGHPDAWTPTPDSGHRSRGHRTRGHWTLTPDTGRRMLLRTGQADKARPAPHLLGHHAERLPAGTPNRVPVDGACGARRPLQARR